MHNRRGPEKPGMFERLSSVHRSRPAVPAPEGWDSRLMAAVHREAMALRSHIGFGDQLESVAPPMTIASLGLAAAAMTLAMFILPDIGTEMAAAVLDFASYGSPTLFPL